MQVALAVERPAAQRARGPRPRPATRVVEQERQAQRQTTATRVVEQERQAQRQTVGNVLTGRCLPQPLQIIEAPKLRMRHRQLRGEVRRAASESVRLRLGDRSAPWALVPARPNSHIDAPSSAPVVGIGVN